MSSAAEAVTQVAQDYYDSPDADTFYYEVWGGEDIHIGLYEKGDTIREASRKTVLNMAGRLENLNADARVLDIGSGYGGAARVLAERFGAHVTCLNLSEVENERNRALTKDAGLGDRIVVQHGSFEDIDQDDGTFDIVWSQDAVLHSGQKKRVLSEVARVLNAGGEFIFTDPMQADHVADPSVLRPILDRIHLDSLGSFAFYRDCLAALGLKEVAVTDLTPQLATHYFEVGQELKRRRPALEQKISRDYIDRMLMGLGHWVEGGKNGHLAWGVMHFQK